MNASKTLTTLAAAGALALGGIAIAQTATPGVTDSPSTGSSTEAQSTGMGAAPAADSGLNNAPATTDSSTELGAQADRN